MKILAGDHLRCMLQCSNGGVVLAQKHNILSQKFPKVEVLEIVENQEFTCSVWDLKWMEVFFGSSS